MVANDYLMNMVYALVQALIRAETAVHELDDEQAESELDKRFEHLTGMVPSMIEAFPATVTATLLCTSAMEHSRLVDEYLRLKIGLLKKRSAEQLVSIYTDLEKVWEQRGCTGLMG